MWWFILKSIFTVIGVAYIIAALVAALLLVAMLVVLCIVIIRDVFL